MPRLPIPPSPSSSDALPPIAIDVRASRRACIAVILISLAMLVALVGSPEPSWLWRGTAGVLALALGWGPVRTVIFRRGKNTVQRIEWNAAGVWQLRDGAGQIHEAQLSPASATLGPWLLLIWKTARRGRVYALVDCAACDPGAYRALKGRLSC